MFHHMVSGGLLDWMTWPVSKQLICVYDWYSIQPPSDVQYKRSQMSRASSVPWMLYCSGWQSPCSLAIYLPPAIASPFHSWFNKVIPFI